MSVFEDYPHRRYNALTGDWILVSPHRAKRPWQGQMERPAPDERPEHDPSCYLCPGSERAGGERNPDYESTFVFTNDFAALLPDVPDAHVPNSPFFQAQMVRGTSRVVCFSPRHDLTLAEMPVDQIRAVVDLWAEQTEELGQRYHWVQVFQNKGAAMGSSNPHPHGQIWAGDRLPNEAAKEDRQQRMYFEKYGSPLLVDYVVEEQQRKERVVAHNADWVLVVPYWAVWPFETLLVARRPVQQLTELGDAERDSLASMLQTLLIKYDNLFEVSFPYALGWHGAPFNGQSNAHWQLHAHLYPPLLRSATVRKFLVGYEMMAEPQRDITAETAAARLRDLPDVHYKAGQPRQNAQLTVGCTRARTKQGNTGVA